MMIYTHGNAGKVNTTDDRTEVRLVVFGGE